MPPSKKLQKTAPLSRPESINEHLGRRVIRIDYDGAITVIADSFEGKRLNSPNDVVVKSDGSIWFTDPPFGLGGFYEGEKGTAELPHTNVYRVDGQYIFCLRSSGRVIRVHMNHLWRDAPYNR